ncbi:hypothetical protein HEP84_08370 [Streptomyces sp. RLB1-33]|uniref:DUF7919 family protein n=1 Tax=Streptomyces mirabilis TaxID=68239 RepID=UPI00143E8F37|nr:MULTISPECIES: hypothetical protein [Streptomyces]QIY69204.1 hypothetical protein HEP84_08370 [Streptomyces sp. RLB1-33]QUW84015.1 hypothetical protein SMIR_36740 [Streptomyces mirabilis]
MAYYNDLSPYEYSDDADETGEGAGSGASLLNVGWLAEGHEFWRGDVPEGFVEALLDLAKDTVNVYRGMHFCDFCPTFQEARKNVRFRDVFIGSGEVHVRGGQGRVYAAPALVVHYVADHGYQPPREFVDAVLATGVGK